MCFANNLSLFPNLEIFSVEKSECNDSSLSKIAELLPSTLEVLSLSMDVILLDTDAMRDFAESLKKFSSLQKLTLNLRYNLFPKYDFSEADVYTGEKYIRALAQTLMVLPHLQELEFLTHSPMEKTIMFLALSGVSKLKKVTINSCIVPDSDLEND